MNDREAVRFCLWILTMSEFEAALISEGVKNFRGDKERVARYTVDFYRSKRQ